MTKKYFGFTFKNHIDESSRKAAASCFMTWYIPAFEAKKYLEEYDKALISLQGLDAKLKIVKESQKKSGNGEENDDEEDEFYNDYSDDIDEDDDDDENSLYDIDNDDDIKVTSKKAEPEWLSKSWFKGRWKEWTEAFGESPSEEDYAYLVSNKEFGCNVLPSNFHVLFPRTFHSPREMADYVKQYVIGQDAAIDHLSVCFFQHYQDCLHHNKRSVKMPVVLLGNTGTGKSEILRRFSELCNCPVVRINSNDVVPNGWRGTTIRQYISSALESHGKSCDNRYTVIVFHEFDKLTHTNRHRVGENSSEFDMDMMREIMRLFESGHPLKLSSGDPYNSDKSTLPTDNLLVLFDGAFYGLSDIIRKRMKCGDRPIGFGKSDYDGKDVDWLQYVQYEDLLEWGFSPELLGRIGEIIPLASLTEDTFMKIMREAKDSVFDAHRQYCQSNNIDLDFSDGALRLIARHAQSSGMGFRNVKTLLARVLNPVYYTIDTRDNTMRHVHIDSAFVARQLGVSMPTAPGKSREL
jgi:ATP-dependent Clp protease ATP-binding subunit ClpX